MESVWCFHADGVEPAAGAADVVAVPFVDDFDLAHVWCVQDCRCKEGVGKLAVAAGVFNGVCASACDG